ncbi:E030025P04Rik [Phodopus roborovskii]|uniref:E030025P04Rik protein n=1 Tax=Phodopus roborovskii TaxID=109678 RepID=A0AAU9YM40_PHORO|nr:E030025P04Rik [Phodopus roborovskii]
MDSPHFTLKTESWEQQMGHVSQGQGRGDLTIKWVAIRDQGGGDPTVKVVALRDTVDIAQNGMQRRLREKCMPDCPSSRRDPGQEGWKNKEPLVPLTLAPTGMWPKSHHLEWKVRAFSFQHTMGISFLQLCYVTCSLLEVCSHLHHPK